MTIALLALHRKNIGPKTYSVPLPQTFTLSTNLYEKDLYLTHVKLMNMLEKKMAQKSKFNFRAGLITSKLP